MSLLMEALRKAEDQKRRLDRPEHDTSTELALEPLSGTAAEGVVPPAEVEQIGAAVGEMDTEKPTAKARKERRLPELPKRMEELDEQFLAHATEARGRVPPSLKPSATAGSGRQAPFSTPPASSPSSSPAASEAADAQLAARAAAQAMFAARQQQSGQRRPLAAIAIAAGFLGALLIGGYFWWQLQAPVGQGTFVVRPAPPAPPPAAPPAPMTASDAAVAIAGAPPAMTITSDVEEEEEPAAKPASRQSSPPEPRSGKDPVAGPRIGGTGATAEAPPAATPAPATTLQISSGAPQNDRAHRAYTAFARGELDEAREIWLELLREDARRLDALHGLAAIALRLGQTEAAADYYRRALEAEPRDALALAGLLSLRGASDARSSESRLKNRLAEQPDSPHLYFALGNLHAREGRWAEAQQAFFNAHATAPDNPDILFNLAVSLDQLRQPALAARYYRLALAAAARQPAGFDPAELERRLRHIAPD